MSIWKFLKSEGSIIRIDKRVASAWNGVWHPHKGNFIVSEKGLRLIDLSGKKTTAVLKAKDRIDLERHYNIKNELKDFGYTYLIFKKKIKKVIRDVKVKLGLKSK